MLNHKKIIAGTVFVVLCASTLTSVTASQIQLQANTAVINQKSYVTDSQNESNEHSQVTKDEEPKIITYVVKSGDTVKKIADTYVVKKFTAKNSAVIFLMTALILYKLYLFKNFNIPLAIELANWLW